MNHENLNLKNSLIFCSYSNNMILSSGGRGRMESEDKRRIRDMEETIRMKNKQIHQLLEDVEEVFILKGQFE